ncbi:hypothetical protein [Psychroserpens sp. NJDZ02]|uniref:hypothetical protein n=1 Tax=Psychroserpens sp. NJDZ02 TaxID=2570561 RepID=UPI0010A7EA3F|nr:hypothetical protein [Psychroserpens sp. NJDZ02]QCE42407.1 hypothetical protein E9099_13660 [Psychroserpens sp. NJDZ02]
MNNTKTFTRFELYKLVWSKPISEIIKVHSLTNSKLRNICIKNDIPLPKTGHWQNIKNNKEVVAPPLPNLGKSYSDISLSIKSQLIIERNTLIKELKKDRTLPFYVPKNFIRTDPLIVRTKKYYSAVLKIKYPGKVPVPKEGVFSIKVSKALRKRAYLFADTFIKLIRARGHVLLVVTDNKYIGQNGTKLLILGESYDIRIREPDYRIIDKDSDYNSAKYYPSGKLMFKLDDLYGHSWVDTNNQLLEDKLPDILAYFELRAKRDINKRIERDIREKEYKLKQKINEELKANKEKELMAFKEVLNHSSRWQKSMDLRKYIQVIESDAIQNNKLSFVLQDWLQWVKDKADWYDPLIEKEDVLFYGVDRDSL